MFNCRIKIKQKILNQVGVITLKYSEVLILFRIG